jgi:hypothetical protein
VFLVAHPSERIGDRPAFSLESSLSWLRRIALALLGRFGARLRFPHLFLLTGLCFFIDLVLPDGLPFVDEVILGLLTLLFASWRGGSNPSGQESSGSGS